MIRRTLLILPVLALAGFMAYRWLEHPGAACDICGRPLHPQTYFRITLKNGEDKDVCCAQCGLRYLRLQPDVAARLSVTDYKSLALIPAAQAFYVEGSDVHLCCSDEMVQREITGGRYDRVWDRCLPSLVAFQNRADAEEFESAHGGRVLSFVQLPRE